jgi:hypothetical protein
MNEPNPQWQTAAIGRVRKEIAPALTFAGRSAEEIDKVAAAIAIRYSLTIEAPTREGVIEQLVEILNAEGYFISKKVVWEKVGEFRKRLGLAHEAFHKILRSPICPPVELHRAGGRKQILAVCSNPVFEGFCLTIKGKKPDRPKWKRKSRAKPAHLLKRARMAGPKRNYATP